MGRVMAKSKGSKGAKGSKEPVTGSRHTGWGRLRPYTAAVVAVAAVFAVSAVIGAHVRSGQADLIKVPSGVPSTGPNNLAVPIKPAIPVTVTVYEDLRSPVSRDFARKWEPAFDSLLNGGRAEIAYRLVTPTDLTEGGTGSAEAANAAACAQDQGKDQFERFVDLLWKKQPALSRDRFASVAYLEMLGRQVHGIQDSRFVPCVQSHDHRGWVRASQRDFARMHLGDVPVIQVNGVTVDPVKDKLTPAKLDALVRRAVVRATASASPSSPATGPAPSASPSSSADPSPSMSSSLPAGSGTTVPTMSPSTAY